MEVAVLSYHGWEIDPALLVDDVRVLRAGGWRDLSLDDVCRLSARTARSARYFHVTLDDGSEHDRECVAALRSVSCPCTLFLSLDTMSAAAREACLALAAPDVALGDHSLRHARVFTSRHVVGFWTSAAPLLGAPERLGLREGDPICSYAGELTTRAFTPDPRAGALCREAAQATDAPPGSTAWQQVLADRLLDDGLAFRRVGRLCVAGTYEAPSAFADRVRAYIAEGRDRLAEATGAAPTVFAHPWWEPSRTADRCLQSLGYRATFSGRGLWSGRSRIAIPRVFVSSDTARPLAPHRAAAAPRATLPRMKALVARAVFS
jgi:hypothetical protein